MTCTKILGCLLMASLAVVFGGCSSDGDGDGEGGGSRSCQALCDDGQAGDCTTVTGDCASFCDAMGRAAPKGGCGDERSDYLGCLNGDANVCNTDCDSAEQALDSCLTGYCVQNASDPDCAVLASSF